MKIFHCIGICLGFVFLGCNEKLDLVGDYKETAVIYGLLDQSDSLHYIKITRAFIGPGNAVTLAQISDSSYFQNVDARVKEFVGGVLQRTWILKDTIITEKFLVEGTTNLVSGLTSPSNTQNFTFKFAGNPGEYLSGGVAAVNTFGNAYVVNTQLNVIYNEYIGVNKTINSFNWTLGERSILPGESTTFTANGKTFYELMKSDVTNYPLIDRRTLECIEFVITGGHEELYNYMVVNAPSSSLSQSKPTYTNLTVSNDKRVVGIFSSRQTLKFYRPFFTNAAQAYVRAIDKKSTKELCQGPLTGLLFFCSNHPGDNVVNQEEPYACQ